MQIHHGLSGLRQLPPGTVISVGNFDGIHLGHRSILRVMGELQGELGAQSLAIATFEPHPLTVLRPTMAPPRLTPPPVKQQLLAQAGVDHLVILPPTPDVLNLEAEAFWKLLRDNVRPLAMVEGETFCFGKGRKGTIEALRRWSAESDVRFRVVEALRVVLGHFWSVPVSSSMIRWLISEGRMRDVIAALGRPYALRGMVVRGNGRGHKLGFPTANLQCDEQMIPAEGVYAALCEIDHRPVTAAVSIGFNPTFNDGRLWVEAHLLDFDADLYGRQISLELLDWVRGQRKFPDAATLTQQMRRDVSRIREIRA